MPSHAYPNYALLLLFFYLSPVFADNQATEIVKQALDHWRGDKSSYTVLQMTIQRPQVQRTMTLRVWTMGLKNALVHMINPNNDKYKGHALLINHGKAWRFSPHTKQITTISLSEMNQIWRTSHFSNNEITKMDDLVTHYTHSIKRTETTNTGQTVYLIEAKPKPDAAVIWGKQQLKIRDDHIILEQAFYDQQDSLVKKRVSSQIETMGGKAIATVQRMQLVDSIDEWTEIVIKEAKFNIKVPRGTFSLSNLRNKRF
jgi:outer membrane lipoprotein-sorting protein